MESNCEFSHCEWFELLFESNEMKCEPCCCKKLDCDTTTMKMELRNLDIEQAAMFCDGIIVQPENELRMHARGYVRRARRHIRLFIICAILSPMLFA